MSTRNLVITGIAHGIGAATAQLLMARGHTVTGLDLREPDIEVSRFVPIDLNSEAAIDAAVARLPERIDGLCNIAGVPPRHDDEARVLQINFLGTRSFTRQLLPRLSEGGSIVNVASRAGQGWAQQMDQVKALLALPDPCEPATLQQFIAQHRIDSTRAYNLSKEALIVWSLAQTENLIQRRLRINTVSPGAINTAILEDFERAFGDRVQKNITRAGRPGQAQEVANVNAFLLSDESSWINGSDLAVDGGMGSFAISDAHQLSDYSL